MVKVDTIPLYLTYDDVLLLPNYSEVLPSDTDSSTQLALNILLSVPIIAAPMDTVCEQRMAISLGELGGMGIIHRNFSIEEQASQVKQVVASKQLAAAAVGIGSDLDERLTALTQADATIVCVDSAHGFTRNVLDAVTRIRNYYDHFTIIAGNVATKQATAALFEAGAHVVKVGMGPGAICTTRVIAGMGVPQFSAVVECVEAAKKYDGSIIADGGIKTSGDIVKALAAGAHAVMLGSLLAGTDEAPGHVVELQGKLYKTYRGMGSIAAMKRGSAARYGQKWQEGQTKKLVAEGVEGLVPHKGRLSDHVHQLVGGLKAGMGYLGATNLGELRKSAQFIRITEASLKESHPHSIVMN